MSRTIRSLSLLCLLSTLRLSAAAEPPVSVSAFAPSRVKAGTGFVVSLTVSKGGQGGFARLQQQLPVGYNAVVLENNNARFQQKGQEVKFIWLELPKEPIFTVSYRVTPDPGITAMFEVAGTFSYIRDDQTVRLQIASTTVSTEGDSRAWQTQKDQPAVSRRIIASRPEEGEYTVELTVQSATTESPARFIDYVPSEYTIRPVVTGSSLFSAEDGRANFYWNSLSAGETVKISYSIRSGRPENRSPEIKGIMLYGDEAVKHSEVLTSEPVKVDASGWNESANIKAPDARAALASATKSAVVDWPSTPSISAPPSGSAQAGRVYYKIQIAATKRSPLRDKEWFSTNMGKTEEVEHFQWEGWRKYQVGTFYSYNDAANARNLARSYSEGAFIVAYRDGSPVPVSEAISWQQANP